MTKPTSVHLVGSIPLASSAEVFEQVCDTIGPYLSRLPDGETGVRNRWIGFQHAMLENHPAVMINPAGRTVPIRDLNGQISRENALFVLNPEFSVEDIEFRPLGYAEAAIESWRIFQERQMAGLIPSQVRFQVCLPTPFATGLLYFHPEAQEAYIEIMKQALVQEMHEICAQIPYNQLAIQWDCCQEILLLEGYFPDDWVYDAKRMAPTVAELGDAVPEAIEVGYHFCYGSPVDAPLVQQKDMQVVVDFCNQIADQLNRSLNFVHLPVSVPDAADAFFQPLEVLNMPEETDIYLGLLHPKVQGKDQARIKQAQQFLATFGVATECGWGRNSIQTAAELLQVHLDAVTD